MKWALAGVGLLLVIVVFSLAALDQKDVVWAGGKPLCPHCRLDVAPYASVCQQCRHAFDWQAREDECDVCLSDFDVEYYEKLIDGKDEAVKKAFADNGATEEQVKDLLEWVDGLKTGACGFCGGTGKWLAKGYGPPNLPEDAAPLVKVMEQQLAGSCPVCFGTGRCILCDGRHTVLFGRETALVEFDALLGRLDRLDRRRDPASAELVLSEISGYVRRQAGRHEIVNVPSFDLPSSSHLSRATARLAFLRKILDTLKG